MKQSFLVRPFSTVPVSLVLSLSLVSLAGCSGSDENQGSQGSEKVNPTSGLTRSELIALKKANKNPADREKAVLKHEIERLRAKGVITETKTSGGKTRGPR